MGLNCMLESQGKGSVFSSPEAASHLWLGRSVSLKAVNSSLPVAGFCWWDQQGLEQPWQCAQLTARSQETRGSWAGEANMWAEREMQPVSKCSLLYVSVSDDILMKISRIWFESPPYGLLYIIGYKRLNYIILMGKACPISLTRIVSPPLFHRYIPFLQTLKEIKIF